MFDFSPNTPSEMVTATAFIAEMAAYFAFYQIALVANRGRAKTFVGPRMLGCIGTIVVAGLLIRYAQETMVDTAVYAALSPREQGEYLGRLLRSIVIPALVIVALAAARAWRDKQARLANERRSGTTSHS